MDCPVAKNASRKPGSECSTRNGRVSRFGLPSQEAVGEGIQGAESSAGASHCRDDGERTAPALVGEMALPVWCGKWPRSGRYRDREVAGIGLSRQNRPARDSVVLPRIGRPIHSGTVALIEREGRRGRQGGYEGRREGGREGKTRSWPPVPRWERMPTRQRSELTPMLSFPVRGAWQDDRSPTPSFQVEERGAGDGSEAVPAGTKTTMRWRTLE